MHETASTYLPPVVNEKIKLVQDVSRSFLLQQNTTERTKQKSQSVICTVVHSLQRVASWQSGSKGEPLYSKVTAYVPEHIRLPVEEFATEHVRKILDLWFDLFCSKVDLCSLSAHSLLQRPARCDEG